MSVKLLINELTLYYIKLIMNKEIKILVGLNIY